MTNLPHHLTRLLVTLFFVVILAVSASASEPNLIGAFFVKGKVGLKWNNVAGAASYNIYRQEAGGEFVNIGSTDKTNHFDTELVAGAVFTYKIAAVVDGNEVFGTTKSVTIPDDIGGFSAPKNLVAREDSRGDGIMLKWDRVKGAIAYNILRSTTPGDGYENVGNATVNKYADNNNIETGNTYYYVITAMNEEFEESGYSNELMFKYGLSQTELDSIAAMEQTIFLDSIDLEPIFKVTEADGKELYYPTALALNSAGDIYVTDANNKRVVVFDKNGNYKNKFGKFMYDDQADNPPDGGLLYPFAITIGPDDNVYVSDVKRNDIQVFSPTGDFIRRIIVPITGDMSPFRSNGMQVYPNGNILTGDVGNHRILIIDPNGNILVEYKASADNLVHYPNGVAILDDNTFAFTNPVMGIIAVGDKTTKKEKFNFGGQGIAVGMWGRATSLQLADDGLLWICDAMGANIQACNTKGESKLAVGNDKFTDNPEYQFSKPRGVIAKDGVLYIINSGKNQLQAIKYTVTKVEK